MKHVSDGNNYRRCENCGAHGYDADEVCPATVVTLTFELDEAVTPRIYASKVALACARGGALRVGETVSDGETTYRRTANVDLEAGLVGKEPIYDVPNIEVVR